MEFTIVIKVEESTKKSSFGNDLLDEIQNEKEQLALTQKVNEQVTLAHEQALDIIMQELNRELSVLGIKFESVATSSKNTNGYYQSYGMLLLGGSYNCVITLNPETYTNKEFPSKYITYNGNYTIQFARTTRRYARNVCTFRKTSGSQEILDSMKHDIKEYLKRNPVK